MTQHSPVLDGSSLNPARFPVMTPSVTSLNRHRIIGFDRSSIQSRPFDLLRTSFAKRIKERNARLIGITSATPAAGKSFLSLNLAASLAKVAEEQVYLVDLDLRRASVAEELGYTPEAGVESYLEGNTANLADLGLTIEDTRLALFPAVKTERNTAELLSGKNFNQMIDIFRHHTGDAIVLFDLPPAFASDDAMISLDQLDGYIMVVDSGRTTKKQISEAVALLDPTPCIGTILNRYQGGLGDAYGYGFGKSDYSRYYE